MQATCERCNGVFTTRTNKRFCSERCRRQAEKQRWRKAHLGYKSYGPKAKPPEKWRNFGQSAVCRQCGTTFERKPGRGAIPKFCSKECREFFHNTKRADAGGYEYLKQGTTVSAICEKCGKPFEAVKRETRYCKNCHPWNDVRKERERKAARYPVSKKQIFERDNYICGICGLPVDRDLRWPDESSASLDHIVPIARGGTHEPSNTQCAHLRCNRIKHDSITSVVIPELSEYSVPQDVQCERCGIVITNRKAKYCSACRHVVRCEQAKQSRELAKQNGITIIVPESKRCGHCKQVKPAGDFIAVRDRPNGLSGWCRVCMNAANRNAKRVARPAASAYGDKTCTQCGTAFVSRNEYDTFCSRACSMMNAHDTRNGQAKAYTI